MARLRLAKPRQLTSLMLASVRRCWRAKQSQCRDSHAEKPLMHPSAPSSRAQFSSRLSVSRAGVGRQAEAVDCGGAKPSEGRPCPYV